jgi:hypothetical protein
VFGFSPAEQNALDALTLKLNQVIAKAARTARVRFVSVQDTFAGHELCTTDPWVVNIGIGKRCLRARRSKDTPTRPVSNTSPKP